MFKENVGRIHPAFFAHSRLFRKFKTVSDNKGDVTLTSPFFVLKYSLGSGCLECDDADVLADFVEMLSVNYGTSITRKEINDSIEWTTVGNKWSVLNAGVCILDGDDTGWDGSVNSIWFDNDTPGEVITIVHQFWSLKMLHDAPTMSVEELNEIGGKVAIPNLVQSSLLYKDDRSKKGVILSLISEIC